MYIYIYIYIYVYEAATIRLGVPRGFCPRNIHIWPVKCHRPKCHVAVHAWYCAHSYVTHKCALHVCGCMRWLLCMLYRVQNHTWRAKVPCMFAVVCIGCCACWIVCTIILDAPLPGKLPGNLHVFPVLRRNLRNFPDFIKFNTFFEIFVVFDSCPPGVVVHAGYCAHSYVTQQCALHVCGCVWLVSCMLCVVLD